MTEAGAMIFLVGLWLFVLTKPDDGKKKGAPAENRNAKKRPKNNQSIQPRNDPNTETEKERETDIETLRLARGPRREKNACFSKRGRGGVHHSTGCLRKSGAAGGCYPPLQSGWGSWFHSSNRSGAASLVR